MALPATDNFNRGSLGANWTLQLNTVQITGSIQFQASASQDSIAYWNADTFNSDHKSIITVKGIVASNSYVGVVVRASGTTGYIFFTDGSSGAAHTQVQRYSAGVFTNIKDIATTFAVNDTMELRVSGASPTTWTVYKNGSQVDTGTDSSGPQSGGAPGIYAFATGGQGDDWTGDNLTSVPYINSVAPAAFLNGKTGIVITGINFGASQGAGTVKISPTDNVADGGAVSQTVTAWGNTSITFTSVRSGLGQGQLYLFITSNAAVSNVSGFPVSFVTSASLAWSRA